MAMEDAGDQETDQIPDLTDYQLARDREPRTRTKPLRFRDESNMAAYAFVTAKEKDTHEPLTYHEVVACEDSYKWKAAMKEEMDFLRKNKTWELLNHLAGQKLVSCKWLFKIKEGIEGVQKPRYKERLVARGFTQRAGIDYNELEQLDVKMAFLHRNLKEVIYMRQPPGFEQGSKSKVKIGSTKSLLKKKFNMKELEEAKRDSWYGDRQGSESQDSEGVTIQDCPVRDCDVERMNKMPYANAVGSSMYLMVCTRPNIAYAVSVVSRYLANLGFVDSDYAKDPDKEAEYMDLTEAVKEAIWLRGLLEELGVELNIVAVNCDNQGAIHIYMNHVFHERTKHINARYHFIREVLEAKTVKLLKGQQPPCGVKGQRLLWGQGTEPLAKVPLPGQWAGVEGGPTLVGIWGK
ncbi:retrovirus-related pol polyprotein from transposon TNT 1-94 [Tanacetum coccineum]